MLETALVFLFSPWIWEQQQNCFPTWPHEDPMDAVHGVTCAAEIGSSTQSPCSLYQMCKRFTVKNLHLVESLEDFPEAVGYQLFLEALQTKIFHRNSNLLKTFCTAYKNLVLKHLNLRGSTSFIDENVNLLLSFDRLTELDLGHCRLGDNHEYLQWVGRLKSLECVSLKDNCLTDIGISSWTLPHRMLATGPELLKTLDLSCNPGITDLSAKYLVKFSHLKSLNLSGTCFTISTGIKKIVTSLPSLQLVSYIPEFSNDVFTTTQGWAEPFISELSSRQRPERTKRQNLKRLRFYGTTCLPKTSAIKENDIKIDESDANSNNYPVMLLLSEERVLPNTLRTTETESLRKQCKKRPDVGELTSPTPFKRQKMTAPQTIRRINPVRSESGVNSELSMADSNLLDSYLKCL